MAGPGLRSVCEALGHPAGPAHGQLRGQQPDDGAGRRAGRLPRASTSTSCRWPGRLRSGTRRRRWPSGPTWSARGSPRCSASSRPSSAAPTWSACWPAAWTTWWGPSSWSEPDPAAAALLIRRHIEAKRRGPRPAVPHHSRDHRRDRPARRPRPSARRSAPGRGPEGRVRDLRGARFAPAPGRRRRRARDAPGRGGQGRGGQVDPERAVGPPAGPPRGCAWWRSTPTSSATWPPPSGLRRRAARRIVAVAEEAGLHRGEDRGPARRGCGRHAAAQSRHLRPGRPAVGRRRPTGCGWWSWAACARPGGGCLCPETALVGAAVAGMHLHDDDVVIMDTHAGVEHFGRALARGFDTAVVVVDPPTTRSQVGVESARLATELGIEQRAPGGQPGALGGRRRPGARLRRARWAASCSTSVSVLPFDEAAIESEPAVDRLLEGSSLAVGVDDLADIVLADVVLADIAAPGRGLVLMRTVVDRDRTGRDHRRRDPAPARPVRARWWRSRPSPPALLAAGPGRPLPHRPGRAPLLEGPRRRRAARASTSAATRWSGGRQRQPRGGAGRRGADRLRGPGAGVGQPAPRPPRGGGPARGPRLQVPADGHRAHRPGASGRGDAAPSSSATGSSGSSCRCCWPTSAWT